MEKFYEENCLYEQHYIKDESVTIGEMITPGDRQARRKHVHPALRALQGRRSQRAGPLGQKPRPLPATPRRLTQQLRDSICRAPRRNRGALFGLVPSASPATFRAVAGIVCYNSEDFREHGLEPHGRERKQCRHAKSKRKRTIRETRKPALPTHPAETFRRIASRVRRDSAFTAKRFRPLREN